MFSLVSKLELRPRGWMTPRASEVAVYVHVVITCAAKDGELGRMAQINNCLQLNRPRGEILCFIYGRRCIEALNSETCILHTRVQHTFCQILSELYTNP